MKKVISALLFATAVQTAVACPNLEGQGPQDFGVIEEYVGRISKLRGEKTFNKTLYSCFKDNILEISWDQTIVLMNKLRTSPYTRFARSSVTEDMGKEYLKANFDMTFADVAVEISNKMSSSEK